MRKLFTTLIIIATCSFSYVGYAQTNNNQVSGTVQDINGKTIEAATINLLRAKDSSLVKLVAADRAGQYDFETIADGKYLVAATAVGYGKSFSPLFELNASNPSLILKPIQLSSKSTSLGNVTVTAKKPLIEQKIDRTIVNVEASITNAGSNALEVLEKSPGISVDKDGNISLKGKAGVMVLVDGRPTQLGASDLANMLRNMQSNQLDQIEIMTNPPAKFDAAGNAGVINIKTKKTKTFGYNGSLSAGVSYGHYLRYNEAFNFNYRHNKVNIFGNLSHNRRKAAEELNTQRNFINPSTKSFLYRFEQEADMLNKTNSYNGKVGLDYTINKKTSIGAVISGFSNPGNFENNSFINKFQSGSLTNYTKSLSISDQGFKNISSNLNFRRQLDSIGKELTADLDYLRYDGANNTSLSNYYFDVNGNKTDRPDTLYGNLPQTINIYSGKLDYVHPLKKGARFEAGIKGSYVSTDNNAVYNKVYNNSLTLDSGRSNHFIYTENINAVYMNLSTPLSKKISAQLGLRLENTSANGNSIGFKYNTTTNHFDNFDTTFKNNYTQLFPTAYLQYKASEKHNIGVNYGRRIRRPNYESLNPFIEYLDRYTFEQGNPNLKPQFSHNVELSHTYKNLLTTTVNYSQTNNIIQQVIEQNELTSETYVKQANIASQRQWGLAVSANMPINKWWTSNLYVNVFNNHFEGVVNGTEITTNGTSLRLNGSQSFKLGKTTAAEVNGWLRTTNIEGVVKIKPVGILSVGFSQQILKNKGSIRLIFRDIFSTQHWRGISKYGSVDTEFQNNNDSRAVSVNLTYRFSKGKINGNGPKRRGSGANDEQSRVGGGNSN